jgi:hypothetical protein
MSASSDINNTRFVAREFRMRSIQAHSARANRIIGAADAERDCVACDAEGVSPNWNSSRSRSHFGCNQRSATEVVLPVAF